MRAKKLQEIGQRLKWIRTTLGLSQRALAQKVGYAQRTVSSWEKGEREIPIPVLYALKDLFRVNINWLLTGEGEPFLTPKEEPVKKKTKRSCLLI